MKKIFCLLIAAAMLLTLAACGSDDAATVHGVKNPGTEYSVMEMENGDRYEGEMRDGLFHGEGTYTFASDGEFGGDVYSGGFVMGNFHGDGTYTFADGTILQGTWEKDMMQGTFILRYTDGTCYRCEFQDNEMISQELYAQGWDSFDDGEEPDDNDSRGGLSGPQFLSPLDYFGLDESDLNEDFSDCRSVKFELHNDKEFLASFVEAALEANPSFTLRGVKEDDYTAYEGGYFRKYIFDYNGSDDVGVYDMDWDGIQATVIISLNIHYTKDYTLVTWYWGDGISFGDSGDRADSVPQLINNGGGGSGGSGGGSGGGFDWDDRDDDKKPCSCGDGTVECSLCDGEGGKEVRGSVPNYSGSTTPNTSYTTWEYCWKCNGNGWVYCPRCGGSGLR